MTDSLNTFRLIIFQ